MKGKRELKRSFSASARKRLITAGCVLWALDILWIATIGIVRLMDKDQKDNEPKVIYSEEGKALPEIDTFTVDHPEVEPHPTIHTIENCAVTGYCACCTPWAHCNQDDQGRVLVASGDWVYPGYCVAVDTDIIPLGASVIIDNIEYTAMDTGVTGNVVDILMTHDEAAVAGRNYTTVKWYVEGE